MASKATTKRKAPAKGKAATKSKATAKGKTAAKRNGTAKRNGAPKRRPTTKRWTCERCEVTASSMSRGKRLALPAGWAKEGRKVYCLSCRREMAAETGLDEVGEDAPRERRAQVRVRAVVEFELKRDPDRSNVEIARAARSSVPAVQKARERLGRVVGTG
jgi:hypothetical protein